MRKLHVVPCISQPPAEPPADAMLATDFIADCLTRALDALDHDYRWRYGRRSPATPGEGLQRHVVQTLTRLQREIDRFVTKETR